MEDGTGGSVLGALEVVVALGATLLLCGVVAQRRRIAPPVLLLAGGTLLGFVPANSALPSLAARHWPFARMF
jgi:hypothetical protein